MMSNPKRIFVSYSHKDRADLDEFLEILRPHLRDDLIEVWDDSDLRAGDDFHRRLEQECAISDSVVLLVSDNFLKSRYCQDVELVWTARRANALEITLVPVILEQCDWKSTILRHFQATPFPGKPIKSFLDRKEGYRAAAEDIKQALQSENRYQWMGPVGAALLVEQSHAGESGFSPEHTSVADIGGAAARVAQEITNFMSVLDHGVDGEHQADHHDTGDLHPDDGDHSVDHDDDQYDWDDHDDGRS